MTDRISEWDREGEENKRELEEKGVEKGSSEGRRAERREGGEISLRTPHALEFFANMPLFL